MVMSKVYYRDRDHTGSISIQGKRYLTQDFETCRECAKETAKKYRNKQTSVRIVETRDGFFIVSHKKETDVKNTNPKG